MHKTAKAMTRHKQEYTNMHKAVQVRGKAKTGERKAKEEQDRVEARTRWHMHKALKDMTTDKSCTILTYMQKAGNTLAHMHKAGRACSFT